MIADVPCSLTKFFFCRHLNYLGLYHVMFWIDVHYSSNICTLHTINYCFSNLDSLQHLIDLTQQRLLGKCNTEQIGEGIFLKRHLVQDSYCAGFRSKDTIILQVQR